ncbi:Solute carrier family 35 member B1 [Babesia sp. Xinjiang]|uniref:Solute carrier family 35 member B1 n=1 Tax=Babesia sp. Xinjiang TaxID=462227 RepID=UPI000A264D3F|nr:Solute carrier family 35 member B1 [Babesia sp. Xinjiang]ORM39561.1 Solute carrier family 35 member B1 [Babesia sp. Xinjiang]
MASALQPRGGASHMDTGEHHSSSEQSQLTDSDILSYFITKRKMKITVENAPSRAEIRRTVAKDVGIAAVLFTLVCTCFIIYQYLQELLMRIPIAGGKKFDYPVFLTFICFATNCITTSILMGGMQIKFDREYKHQSDEGEERRTVFDQFDWKIAVLGLIAATSNVCAMVSSLTAVKYVGVPTQIVIKSAKMIPILIGGFIIFRKRYPWYDYVAVLIITACIICFNFAKPNSKMDGENTPWGLFMCFFSLFWDGVTGPIEDKMLSLKDLHPYMLLFVLNVFGFPLVTASVFIFEGLEPFNIIAQEPKIWGYLALLSLTATIGQVVIVICLKLYGSLYTTLMTTIRKIASSLISIFMFNHAMSVLQWIAMSFTFATLLVRQYIKQRLGAKKKGEKESAH